MHLLHWPSSEYLIAAAAKLERVDNVILPHRNRQVVSNQHMGCWEDGWALKDPVREVEGDEQHAKVNGRQAEVMHPQRCSLPYSICIVDGVEHFVLPQHDELAWLVQGHMLVPVQCPEALHRLLDRAPSSLSIL